MFGWTPSEPVIVQLRDLADYGSGGAYAAPHSMLAIEVEPLSHAFETYPASERMYMMMNHELVHVASNDVSSEADRRWRRFFLGKVAAAAAEPGIAGVQLPDASTVHGPSLVPGRRRRIHGDMDERRVGPRTGRL